MNYEFVECGDSFGLASTNLAPHVNSEGKSILEETYGAINRVKHCLAIGDIVCVSQTFQDRGIPGLRRMSSLVPDPLGHTLYILSIQDQLVVDQLNLLIPGNAIDQDQATEIVCNILSYKSKKINEGINLTFPQ